MSQLTGIAEDHVWPTHANHRRSSSSCKQWGYCIFEEKKMQEYVSTTQGCNSLCNLQMFSRGLIDVKHLEEA
jgi:hypothetical protein